MILKLNKEKVFKPIFRILGVILLVFVFFLIYAGVAGFIEYLPALLLIISIPVIPTAYLFIEYFIVTRNQTVEITSEFISIKYEDGKSSYYQKNELEVVKLYKSKMAEKGHFNFSTIQTFYHAEIFTKSGERLILTSFLGPNFDEALDLLKSIRKDVKRSIFSSIYFKLF